MTARKPHKMIRFRMVPCPGIAHRDEGRSDSCAVCAPGWGRVPVARDPADVGKTVWIVDGYHPEDGFASEKGAQEAAGYLLHGGAITKVRLRAPVAEPRENPSKPKAERVRFGRFPKLAHGDSDEGAPILIGPREVGVIQREIEWVDVGSARASYRNRVTGYRVVLFDRDVEPVFATAAQARAHARATAKAETRA